MLQVRFIALLCEEGQPILDLIEEGDVVSTKDSAEILDN